MAVSYTHLDSEGSFCREKITLGFRRLSIIDLEDGQQPMESADGNLHIVFNGEIYDYKELRAELETFGISFCTHSCLLYTSCVLVKPTRTPARITSIELINDCLLYTSGMHGIFIPVFPSCCCGLFVRTVPNVLNHVIY